MANNQGPQAPPIAQGAQDPLAPQDPPPHQNTQIPPVPQVPHAPQATQVLSEPTQHMTPLNLPHLKLNSLGNQMKMLKHTYLGQMIR